MAARRAAHRVSCLNNLRQLHAAQIRQQDLTLNALGDRDPNWTVGGILGKDVE